MNIEGEERGDTAGLAVVALGRRGLGCGEIAAALEMELAELAALEAERA